MKKYKVINLTSQDEVGFKWSHLYILSDDKINVGDCYIDKTGSSAILCDSALEAGVASRYSYPKVIATTDKSLGLPLIPQGFVQKWAASPYNEVIVRLYDMLDEAWEPTGEKRVVLNLVDESWNRDIIHFWFMDHVSKYLKEGLNPSDVLKELDPTLDTLSIQYNDFIEDMKADQLLGEWKAEGRPS